MVGPERHDAGGVVAREALVGRPYTTGMGPLAVDVDVVRRRVEVPGPDSRRPAADLAEAEPLRPVEPLHVGRRGTDVEGPDHPAAELPDLVVEGRRVDPVGGDELRRDPAVAHGVQHVRVVVRDPVMDRVTIDADRVVEALVPLDELLDRDRLRVAERVQGAVQLTRRVDARRAQSPGGRAGFQDQGIADRVGERVRLGHVVHRRRRRGPTPASRSTSFIEGLSRHSQVVRTEVPGMPRASRT